MSSLTRIVPWSQQLVCEVLQPGDLAVDLTTGKGRDTLALAEAVGPTGQVVAFDVQTEALDQSQRFLEERGQIVIRCSVDIELPEAPGVYLYEACHSQLENVVRRPVKALIANLGYLPGGNQTLITEPESTLAALQQSLDLLQAGGRLAVVVYPSHPGGAEEGAAVNEFFTLLPSDKWQVLSLRAANRPEAPYLLVAERTS
jgi:16S rRNA C1402 N4-methylase RsmH